MHTISDPANGLNPLTFSSQNQQKAAAAREALQFIVPGEVLGVGSGSTVNALIAQLQPIASQIKGAVAASRASADALSAVGIAVLDLNQVERLSVYVDGADEIDPSFALIKGGGAALTHEKIIASAADTFICIVDSSKTVPVLGAFPLPIEVIPMASAQVSHWLSRQGGTPRLRSGVTTDNGNWIIDVTGLSLANPDMLESEINQLPGVVCNGIFARRRADIRILANAENVTVSRRS